MTDINTSWPPNYTIRHSTRAKQVILQISPQKGLVIIVPMHRRHPKIEEVLRQKQLWIQKNLAHLQEKQQLQQSPSVFIPPTTLQFHAIGKVIHFQYQKTAHKHLKIIPMNKTTSPEANSLIDDGNTLQYLILGPIEQHSLLIQALKRFLKTIAHQYLIPWLEQLSLAIGLPFLAVSIRSQSTLWGSCTAAKKISLNVKLLFLPQELTRYVLLHELCHTQHLNHSKRYWNLLKRFDPNCLIHRKMLRNATQYLPTWIEDTPE